MVSTALWNVKVVPTRHLAVRRRVVEHLHRLPDHRVFVLRGDVGEVIAVGAAILLTGDDAAVGLRALELAAVVRQKELDLVGRQIAVRPVHVRLRGVGGLVLVVLVDEFLGDGRRWRCLGGLVGREAAGASWSDPCEIWSVACVSVITVRTLVVACRLPVLSSSTILSACTTVSVCHRRALPV